MESDNIIVTLRKEKGWSQTELATKSGASRKMIGNHKRGVAVPSIEATKKIAESFEVSLDCLAGKGTNSKFGKKSVRQLQGIEKYIKSEKSCDFALLDIVLFKNKIQAIFE